MCICCILFYLTGDYYVGLEGYKVLHLMQITSNPNNTGWQKVLEYFTCEFILENVVGTKSNHYYLKGLVSSIFFWIPPVMLKVSQGITL